MTKTPATEAPAHLSPLQVATLVLSVYVLLALFVQSVYPLSAETTAFLARIDHCVCLVFLADFVVQFFRAPSRLAYMKWGWIDLLSSIPMLESFRIGRLARVISVIRLLRAFRSLKYLLNYLFRQRRTTSLAAVASISFVFVIFSALAVLQFETSPEANIRTPGDAFWWAYVTITTVGYGDKYPISHEGRIVAVMLMTIGVGLFGIFTGFVASHFVEPELEEEEADIEKLTAAVDALRLQVKSLEDRLTDRMSGE